jgi:hypothetical protein
VDFPEPAGPSIAMTWLLIAAMLGL